MKKIYYEYGRRIDWHWRIIIASFLVFCAVLTIFTAYVFSRENRDYLKYLYQKGEMLGGWFTSLDRNGGEFNSFEFAAVDKYLQKYGAKNPVYFNLAGEAVGPPHMRGARFRGRPDFSMLMKNREVFISKAERNLNVYAPVFDSLGKASGLVYFELENINHHSYLYYLFSFCFLALLSCLVAYIIYDTNSAVRGASNGLFPRYDSCAHSLNIAVETAVTKKSKAVESEWRRFMCLFDSPIFITDRFYRLVEMNKAAAQALPENSKGKTGVHIFDLLGDWEARSGICRLLDMLSNHPGEIVSEMCGKRRISVFEYVESNTTYKYAIVCSTGGADEKAD